MEGASTNRASHVHIHDCSPYHLPNQKKTTFTATFSNGREHGLVKLLNEYKILLPHEHFVEQLLVVAEKLVYRKKVR